MVAPFQDVTPVRLEIEIYAAKEIEKPKKFTPLFPFLSVLVVKEKIIAFSHYY